MSTKDKKESQKDAHEHNNYTKNKISLEEEWIPPNRPLVGDRGQSHLYVQHTTSANNQDNQDDNQDDDQEDIDIDDDDKELAKLEAEFLRLEQEEKQQMEATARKGGGAEASAETGVDWLETRRSVLRRHTTNEHDWVQPGQPSSSNSGMMIMMIPDQAKSRRRKLLEETIPVRRHMLLSRHEIVTCLETMGAQDTKVVIPPPALREQMGMGKNIGLIVASSGSRHPGQLKVMADALTRVLRQRDLQSVGVVGAKLGPDGGNRSRSPSSLQEQTWYVVDCGNYLVHMMDPTTRQAVNLEALWSGQDGLHKVNMLNEAEVEDYVASHPVPDSYGGSGGGGGSIPDWEETLQQLQKNRWTAPHKPVVPHKTRRRR